MKEIKDRIAVGRRIITSSIGGIFGTPSANNKRRKIQMCLEWKKIPYRNQWTCLKFFPPKRPVVKEESSSVKDQSNCKVDPISGINECDSKDEAVVESEETETTTEYAYDYPILENKQKNETVEKGEDNSIETDDTDE